MTTAALVVTTAVNDAIQQVHVSSEIRAGWAVVSRSSAGMNRSVLRRIAAAARGGTVAPLVSANTFTGTGTDRPLLLIGETGALGAFLSPAAASQTSSLISLAAGGHGLVLGAGWAAQHHYKVGSSLLLQTPRGTQSWRVAGLVHASLGNGGAIAVAPLAEVASAFDRGSAVDALLVRAPGAGAALRATLERAAAGAAEVVPPSRSTASYAQSFKSVRSLLSIFVAVAVLIAAAVVYFCWRLTLEDTRPSIARLRLSGAGATQLALGSGAIMALGLLVGVLLGAPLGIAAGSSLSGFSRQLVTITELAANPGLPVARPVEGASAIAIVMFGVVWLVTLRAFSHTSVIDAVDSRRVQLRAAGRRPLYLLLAGVGLVLSAVIVLALPSRDRVLAFVSLTVFLLGASALLPAVTGRVLRGEPGFVGLLAGRELSGGTARVAPVVAVFALAIAMSLALQGTVGSIKSATAASVRAWTRADLYVQAAPSGKQLQDDKLTEVARRQIARLPGVLNTSYFTFSTLELGGTRIPLWTWGTQDREALVALRVTTGAHGAQLWKDLEAGGVAVSSNYARLHSTHVGSRLVLPDQMGERVLRVVSVFDDVTSDSGVLLVDPYTYAAMTGDHRYYQLLVRLAPGASRPRVSAAIHHLLGPAFPRLVVWNTAQIRNHFAALTNQLTSAFTLFARAVFLLALLIGAATTAGSLTARRRSLAMARVIGASTATLRRSLMREALATGAGAWVLGFPVGLLMTDCLLHVVSLQDGVLPPIQLPISFGVVALPLTLLLTVGSLLAAAPRGAAPGMQSALAQEE